MINSVKPLELSESRIGFSLCICYTPERSVSETEKGLNGGSIVEVEYRVVSI